MSKAASRMQDQVQPDAPACLWCGRKPGALGMADAAAYCGIKERTWEGYYRLWDVPYYKIGRTVVFRPEELDEWMAGWRVVGGEACGLRPAVQDFPRPVESLREEVEVNPLGNPGVAVPGHLGYLSGSDAVAEQLRAPRVPQVVIPQGGHPGRLACSLPGAGK